VEGVVGFFAREGALRTDLSGNPTFRELLRRIRDTVMEAYANQDVAVLERVGAGVAQELKAYRSLGNVRVRYDHVSESALALEGLEVEPLVKEAGPPAEVTYEGFRVLDLVDAVRCIFVYRVLPHTVMEQAVEQFGALLDAVLADPGLRIGAVPLRGDGAPARPVPA
jgi:non-ribosomal peptide synthetase component F